MAAGAATPDRIETVRRRLASDYVYFAENAVWIVNKQAEFVRFKLKRPQKRLARGLMGQRDAGQPQRAMALKARQVGISTLLQSILTQRATQHANHLALVLAQDRKTAGKLFKMGETAWARLPGEIKPEVARKADTEDRKYMVFGEASAQLRRSGVFGLNSSMEISTAAGLAGRGLTPRTLHVSEYAWWEKGEAINGVINGVPDDPESLIVMESTANGHNHFKDEWDLAVSGESGYYAFFSPWYEEEEYRRPFMNRADLAGFRVGAHVKWGADEPALADQIRADYLEWHADEPFEWMTDEDNLELRVIEHLNWRRWAIASKSQGKLDRFKREYPGNADEAFLSTGKRVFDGASVMRVIKNCERTDPPVPSLEKPGPVEGAFRVVATRKGRDRTKNIIEIPTEVEWVAAAKLTRADEELAIWRLWSAPQKAAPEEDGFPARPDGQYIVFCDPASGETDDKGVTHAEHAIQVIDHRTRAQVAEWVGQSDPDLVALEMLKVALHFNKAWAWVERTGGYGLSIGRKLAIDYRYSRTGEETSKNKRGEKRKDIIGWSTDSVSKPLMEAEGHELLRLEKDGIRSMRLARQMLTFIRNDRGRTGPQAGSLSDALMAWLGAQIVAKMTPIRPDRSGTSEKKKPQKERRRRPKTGY